MPLDLSGLTRIGNMTSGGGLNGIFDGTTATTGYIMGSLGYAGIDFDAAPKAIDRVEVFSSANGFDASSSNTSVSLLLYAKNGAAPTSTVDGTLLGSRAFTDVNLVLPYTLYNIIDLMTQWRYVWVVGASGVWVQFSGIVMHERPVPVVSAVERPLYERTVDFPVPLQSTAAEIIPFRTDFTVAVDAVAEIDLRVDTAHNGGSFASAPLSVGFILAYREADTYAGLASAPLVLIDRATDGCNICERDPQHYGKNVPTAAMPVLANKFYQITVLGNSKTSGSPTANGLASLNVSVPGKGLNRLAVHVDPDCQIIRI